MDMLDEDELRAIANSKNSTFKLEAVIAAKSPESRDKTHESIKKICAVIIEAYKQVNDPYASAVAKKDSVRGVTQLKPQLDWLITFTIEETDWCHTPQLKKKMKKLSDDLERFVKEIYSDFLDLERDLDKFRPIFNALLEVLKKMTEFFREGHAAEVCRVIDSGDDNFYQAKNLLNIEFPNLLVAQAKLLKERTEDYLKKTRALLYIQQDENETLRKKFQTVEALLDDTNPKFIMASKDHLVAMGQSDHPGKKAYQKEQYDVVYSCFEEVKRILEAIRVRYTNAFDESKNDDDDDILDDPASDLFDSLQTLRTPQPEEKKLQATQAIKPQTQEVLRVMDTKDCPLEMKQELLGAIKMARDGSVPEYFDAIRCMEETLNKAKAMQPQPLQISFGSSGIKDKGGPKDLLEAAKQMCAALSSLNISLDL